MRSREVEKADDNAAQIERMLNRMTPQLRRTFLANVAAIRGQRTLAELETLVLEGRLAEAIQRAGEAYATFATEWVNVMVFSGQETGKFITRAINTTVNFDQVNTRAVAAMQENRLRLVQGLGQQQRDATQQAIIEGIRAGANPREQARNFRDSIGLTATQEQHVRNFRDALQTDPIKALRRKLRDRRFDPSILGAIRDDKPLTAAQIDKMVGRYRDRYLKHRAEVIARTEALRSVHEGAEEMFSQAIDSGALDPGELVRIWNTAKDERVRSSHAFMHGQIKNPGEPFLSGNGNRLRFPGDTNAPASETVQCRCVVSTRLAPMRLETSPEVAVPGVL